MFLQPIVPIRNVLILTVLTAALFRLPGFAADPRVVIAIQPVGTVTSPLVEAVKIEIASKYDADVVVRPAVKLPPEAYYKPRGRYRADKLLAFLDRIERNSSKVIGLTTVDISTTKGPYPDWGILGLGNIGGHACVVSTFRMQRKKVGEAQFGLRLAKVVAHELGHTFGLEHCPHVGCLMEDARGTVRTVDREKDFCDQCKKQLSSVLKP
jgi:archaemetzincin